MDLGALWRGWGVILAVLAGVGVWYAWRGRAARDRLAGQHPRVRIGEQEYRVDFAIEETSEPEYTDGPPGRRDVIRATVLARTPTGWRGGEGRRTYPYVWGTFGRHDQHDRTHNAATVQALAERAVADLLAARQPGART